MKDFTDLIFDPTDPLDVTLTALGPFGAPFKAVKKAEKVSDLIKRKKAEREAAEKIKFAGMSQAQIARSKKLKDELVTIAKKDQEIESSLRRLEDAVGPASKAERTKLFAQKLELDEQTNAINKELRALFKK